MTLSSDQSPYGHLGPNRLPGDDVIVWTQEALALPVIQEVEAAALCVSGKRFAVDVDGLLVHSEPWILRAILSSMEGIASSANGSEFRFSPSDIAEIRQTCFGVSDNEMSLRVKRWLEERRLATRELQHLTDEEFIRAFRAAREEMYLSFAREGLIQPMAGAIDFLNRAYEVTGPIALNTGSPSSLQEKVLQYVLGPLLELERVCPRELRVFIDTPGNQGKPDPAGYILAAARLGVDPRDVIAVEDRANGALSALRAGCGMVVCVPENLECRTLFHGKNAIVKQIHRKEPPYIIASRLDQILLISACELPASG